MKQDLVKVNLHGILGDAMGHKIWNLAVKSVSQALNAIEVLSKRKLYKFLHENDKNGIKYSVLINGREFLYDKIPTENDIDSIKNCELCAIVHGLKTIDIVPVLSGARDVGLIIAGILLIIVGIILTIYGVPVGPYLIVAGIGLLAAGIINMLAKPPEEPEIQARQKTSYLFSGPTNTLNEGGPVPLGYGRLRIGSAVISASYELSHFETENQKNIPSV